MRLSDQPLFRIHAFAVYYTYLALYELQFLAAVHIFDGSWYRSGGSDSKRANVHNFPRLSGEISNCVVYKYYTSTEVSKIVNLRYLCRKNATSKALNLINSWIHTMVS